MYYYINMKRKINPFKVIVALSILSIVLLITSIKLFTEVKAYKEDCLRVFKNEWFNLYRMTDTIENYYITGIAEAEEYKHYVNQSCYNYNSCIINQFYSDVYRFLINVYDIYFRILAYPDNANYKNFEKARDDFKELNSEFKSIAEKIIADESPDWIFDEKSKKYKEFTNEMNEIRIKYEKKLKSLLSEKQFRY